MLRRRYRAV